MVRIKMEFSVVFLVKRGQLLVSKEEGNFL